MSSPPGADRPAVYDPHDEEHVSRVAVVIAQATLADGQPPFSDQSLVELRSGVRRGLVYCLDGVISAVAVVTTGGVPREAELVVSPSARRRGLGNRLLEHLLEAGGELLVWAHGDHPDARALAARHFLRAQRELLQMRMPLGVTSGDSRAITVVAFQPGIDDEEWLALNAVAFADHPEQGGLGQPDLDARIAEDWFDADDFLIARGPYDEMTGFCWLKIDTRKDERQPGEFYAVGVAPESQGTGLGRALVNAGLARLESRGILEASLYVEADNSPAVSLYRSVGFTTYSIDIQYSSLS